MRTELLVSIKKNGLLGTDKEAFKHLIMASGKIKLTKKYLEYQTAKYIYELETYSTNNVDVINYHFSFSTLAVRVLGYYWEDFGRNGVFRKNQSIRKVSMPDSIQEIGEGCFEECRNLEEVRFSEELEGIGYSAFWGCTSLKYVEFPESLKVIGSLAFGWCESLELVELPEGVEKIEGNSFWKTGWEESFPEDFVIVGKNVLIYYGGDERKVKVPEGVEYIGMVVFKDKKEMESLELPVSVKKCTYMLEDCKNLKYVTVRNPLMEFGKDESRDVFSEYGSELTLIGEKGSTAEAYAEKWGHGFMELQPEE